MPFYFHIPLPGPFGYSVRIGSRKRRRRRPAKAARRMSVPATRTRSVTVPDNIRRAPAPKVATEAEKVKVRQEIRHAIERADDDAFELAMARYADIARTKAGAGNLGTLGEIKVLPAEEKRALTDHLDVIRDCIGHQEKLATAQAAAERYNLIAAKTNRRIGMLMCLETPGVSDDDRLERIEVS